jgi:hypothetical protein
VVDWPASAQVSVRNLIAAIFEHLAPKERVALEKTILSLRRWAPKSVEDLRLLGFEQLELLYQIPDCLLTHECRAEKARLLRKFPDFKLPEPPS